MRLSKAFVIILNFDILISYFRFSEHLQKKKKKSAIIRPENHIPDQNKASVSEVAVIVADESDTVSIFRETSFSVRSINMSIS